MSGRRTHVRPEVRVAKSPGAGIPGWVQTTHARAAPVAVNAERRGNAGAHGPRILRQVAPPSVVTSSELGAGADRGSPHPTRFETNTGSRTGQAGSDRQVRPRSTVEYIRTVHLRIEHRPAVTHASSVPCATSIDWIGSRVANVTRHRTPPSDVT